MEIRLSHKDVLPAQTVLDRVTVERFRNYQQLGREGTIDKYNVTQPVKVFEIPGIGLVTMEGHHRFSASCLFGFSITTIVFRSARDLHLTQEQWESKLDYLLKYRRKAEAKGIFTYQDLCDKVVIPKLRLQGFPIE